MASCYHPDQSVLCNSGEQFGSEYITAPEMLHTVNWTQQSQATDLPPLAPATYPNSVCTRLAKSLDDQTRVSQSFFGYCPSTTPLSCPSTPTSPVTSVKTELDGFDGHHINSTEAVLSDDQLVNMSVRDLNYLLQGSDRRVITAYKQKRRTLKNRGYALSCRVRRVQMQQHLEEENNALKRELAEVKVLLAQTQHQLRFFQQREHPQQQLQIQSTPTEQQHRLQTQYFAEKSPISGSSSWSTSSDWSPVRSYDTLRDLF